MSDLTGLIESVVTGNVSRVQELTRGLLATNINPVEIINNGLIAGMNIVGPRFKNGEMFVPEVLMAARAMSSGLEIVKPLIADSEVPTSGTVILGTVKGDLHDIGKNLVGMMLEGAGFKVINLGVDIPPEKFAAAAVENNANIIAMSALLTTTMLTMKDAIDIMAEQGLRNKVKIIIGGAPVSQDFADEIGADGFAADAASAIELCKALVG